MKILFNLLITSLLLTQCARANDLIVKISDADCATCNLQLINLRDLNFDSKYLILKNGHARLEEMLDLGKRTGFHCIVSDSVFYARDSSERSTIYVVSGSTLLYSAWLYDLKGDSVYKKVAMYARSLKDQPSGTGFSATVKKSERQRFSAGGTTLGKRAFVYNNFIRHNNSVILYRFGQSSFVKIDLATQHSDTLSIDRDTLAELIYMDHYGRHYKDSMKVVLSAIDPSHQNLRIVTMTAQGDTIITIASVYGIKGRTNDMTHFCNIVYMVKLVGNGIISLTDITELEQLMKEYSNGRYLALPQVVYDYGKYYVMPVFSEDSAHADSKALFRFKLDGKKLKILGFENYGLPEFNIKYGLGYRRQPTYVRHGRYFMFGSSGALYDVVKQKSYQLPFPVDNLNSAPDTKNVRHQYACQVYDLQDNGENDVLILVRFNEVLKTLKLKKSKEHWTIVDEKLITEQYPNDAFSFPTFLMNNQVWTMDKTKQQLIKVE